MTEAGAGRGAALHGWGELEPDSQDLPWRPARAHTDWLRNTLTVTGPTEAVARFRAAAAGSGVIPWRLDLDALEEEFLLPMAAPQDGVRAISLSGAKLLARRLRDAAALNHQRALARIDTDRRCPLDLHRLLPVPPSILALGPEEGASRDWLSSHWGVTRPLRQVEALPGTLDGRRKKMAEMRVGFWSADWSPWQAILQVRRTWPDLSFMLQPDYAPQKDVVGPAAGEGTEQGRGGPARKARRRG